MQQAKPAAESVIDEDGSFVFIIRKYMLEDEALKLCEKLKEQVKWEKHNVVVHGKSIAQPRQVYACGNEGLTHRYSGLELPVHKWIPEVKEICQQIMEQFEVKFNACLLNEYKDGSQYIGFHSDRESLGLCNMVATVSLGGSRDFYFMRKVKSPDKLNTIKTTLHNGDLVIMMGKCQEQFIHGIPKRAHADYRISLTYRLISN